MDREGRSIELLLPEKIELSATEVSISRKYVERVSRLVFDILHSQPTLRAYCLYRSTRSPVTGCFTRKCRSWRFSVNSCLALSMKQLALKALGDKQRVRENVAIQYHQQAIKA